MLALLPSSDTLLSRLPLLSSCDGTEQRAGLCTKLNRYSRVRGSNLCIDPESGDLFTGGFNVWVRTARNLIDYLFDCMAGAKSVTRLKRQAKISWCLVSPLEFRGLIYEM
jgi:hypothetical protein